MKHDNKMAIKFTFYDGKYRYAETILNLMRILH